MKRLKTLTVTVDKTGTADLTKEIYDLSDENGDACFELLGIQLESKDSNAPFKNFELWIHGVESNHYTPFLHPLQDSANYTYIKPVKNETLFGGHLLLTGLVFDSEITHGMKVTFILYKISG